MRSDKWGSEWTKKRIGDIVSINELSINRTWPHEEIEYIDIDSVEEGHIARTQKMCLDDAPSRARRIVRDNDILISTVRPNLKHYALVKKASHNLIASTGFAVITAKDIDPAFLYYYLTTDAVTNYLTAIADAHTSAYPSFNPGIIENMEIKIPSLQEQKRIAHILSSLDEKIDLNRQMNVTLEQIAEALFRQWFLEFEFPDEKGRPYRSSGGKMIWCEELKRELPKGWGLKAVTEVCQVVDCLHTKKPNRTQTGRTLLQLCNIGDNYLIDLSDRYSVSDSDYAEWTKNIEVREGDCIITNAGRVGAIAQIPYGGTYGIGRNFTAIRPMTIPPSYLLYYLASEYGTQQIERNTDSGTIFNSLNVRGIMRLKTIIPSRDTMQKFEKFARHIRKKMEYNSMEFSNLIESRNSVLPRLMSGELLVESD